MNGKYLKQLRMEKGLTQSELAEMLGYSDKSAVAQIERDHFELNQEKIKQYAEIFNVSVLDIMGFEPDGSIEIEELSKIYMSLSETHKKP